MFLPLLLAALAGCPQSAPAGDGAPTAGLRLELPPGPLHDAWEAVRATPVAGAALAIEPWPAWTERGAAGWGGAGPWRRWLALVRAERGARSADPRRRAELAELARVQARDEDAWTHLLATRSDPRAFRFALAAFFPGVPASAPRAADGRLAALPGGVLLRPALPPPSADADERPAGRAMTLTDLRVGETRLELKLTLEGDGVQVDVLHRGGPPATVRLALPAPAGLRIASTYADWERLDDPSQPIALTASAEVPDHAAWGRFRRSPTPYPSRVPDELPRALRTSGIVVRAPGEAGGFYERLAETWGQLLAVDCRLAHPGPPPASAGLAPLRVDLTAAAERELKLTHLFSQVERWALAAGVAPSAGGR